MKNIFLIAIALVCANMGAKAQASFELRFSNPFYETVLSTTEKNDGAFLTLGVRHHLENEPLKSLLISYSNESDTNVHIIQKSDTAIALVYVFQKPDGNFFFIGDLQLPEDAGGLYFLETTQDYEPVWENFYPLPEPYDFLDIINYIVDSDNNIVISCNAYYQYGNSYYDHLYVAKADMQGQLLALNIPDPPYDLFGIRSLLEKQDNSGYILIGGFDEGKSLKEWIEFDLDLNVTASGLIDWAKGGLDFSAIQLDNGNYIMESVYFDELSLGLLDPDFNLIKDTLFAGGGDYAPFQGRSIGYVSNDRIWIGAVENDPYWIPGTEFYHLYIYDSNLNLKGVKFYGGDTRYFMMDLVSTNDGGCILSGDVPYNVGPYSTDIYINKVAYGDLVTHAEDTPNPYDMDISVFPNPVVDILNIVTARRGLEFRLFSTDGVMVRHSLLSENHSLENIADLRSGFYFYAISENGRMVQSGKLMKK